MAAAKKNEEVETNPGDIEVDPNEPEEVEDPETPEVPEPQSRGAKKAARGTLHQEAETLRADNERLRQENAERAAREAAASGYALGMRQAMGGGQKDPLEEELAKIRQENEELVSSYAAHEQAKTLTPELQKQFQGRADGLRERQMGVMVEKRMRASQPDPRAAQAQQAYQILSSRHPEVSGNQKAFAWANARYQMLVADGHPENIETVDLAMNEAKTKHFPSSPKPDPTLQRKLVAQPRGGGAPAAAGETVRLTPKDQQMADEMWPNLPPKKRYQQYAKVVAGKKSA